MVGGPGDGDRPVRALGERLDAARREVRAERVHPRLLAGLGDEVGGRRRRVDVDEVGAAAAERLLVQRLGEPALERDDERLVVLVAGAVDHDDDPVEAGQRVEREAAQELGVLKREPGR